MHINLLPCYVVKNSHTKKMSTYDIDLGLVYKVYTKKPADDWRFTWALLWEFTILHEHYIGFYYFTSTFIRVIFAHISTSTFIGLYRLHWTFSRV